MTTPTVTLPDVTVGNRFDVTIQFQDATQDFTNIVAASILRNIYTQALAFTFPTPLIVFPTPGDTTTFQITLTMTGAQTTTAGLGAYIADVKLSMTNYGPYTPVAFSFVIVPAET